MKKLNNWREFQQENFTICTKQHFCWQWINIIFICCYETLPRQNIILKKNAKRCALLFKFKVLVLTLNLIRKYYFFVKIDNLNIIAKLYLLHIKFWHYINKLFYYFKFKKSIICYNKSTLKTLFLSWLDTNRGCFLSPSGRSLLIWCEINWKRQLWF